MQKFSLLLLLGCLFIFSCGIGDDPMDMDDDNNMDNDTTVVDIDTTMMNDTMVVDNDTIIIVDSLAVITLTVTNIIDLEGGISIALYDNEADWDADIESRLTENEYAYAYPDADENPTVVTFTGVEAGEYGFSIYHDVDGNGEMKLLAGLVPQEPYGFSQNFVPSFSPPNFSDCYFEVNYFDTLNIDITLIQP